MYSGKQKTYYFWINFIRGKNGNEWKCKFQLISIPKIRLRFKNSDFCVISESHSILSLSLWPDGTLFFLQNLEKFHPKNVQPLLKAKIIKITNKLLNMDPSSDCFLCARQIWTRYDHWESLKIGSALLYQSYCI